MARGLRPPRVGSHRLPAAGCEPAAHAGAGRSGALGLPALLRLGNKVGAGPGQAAWEGIGRGGVGQGVVMDTVAASAATAVLLDGGQAMEGGRGGEDILAWRFGVGQIWQHGGDGAGNLLRLATAGWGQPQRPALWHGRGQPWRAPLPTLPLRNPGNSWARLAAGAVTGDAQHLIITAPCAGASA